MKSTHKYKYQETIHSIFRRVYKFNMWGGERGEFYSGSGSHSRHVDNYASIVSDFIEKKSIRKIVEIGCGDFYATNKILSLLELKSLEFNYVGYEVVDELVKYNLKKFGSPTKKFVCKDSSTGRIKNGDLLIIRQVFQHLSNKMIMKIVEKFPNYKYVIFTEHQLSKFTLGHSIIPNKDIDCGAATRLIQTSGVYLDHPPFNCKIDTLMYSAAEYSYNHRSDINTFLITS